MNIEFLNDIKSDTTKLLWYDNKYDGVPICGMMKYKGRNCYYKKYDTDININYYTDSQLLKAGHTQEEINLMTDDDKEWIDEVSYYKIYKLSKKDLKYIQKQHNRFRKYVGTHCDYEGERVIRPSHLHAKYYDRDYSNRDNSLDSLLDNIFLKVFKKIRHIFVRKHMNISNVSDERVKYYEKDVIGYFKI